MKPVLFFSVTAVIVLFLSSGNSIAKHESDHPLSNEDWGMVQKNVDLLDTYNYMPSLLPIIMRNRDTLQLTPEQVKIFRTWRKENYTRMVNLMNKIIENRISFKQASLDAKTSNKELAESQVNILTLQQELLSIKLSCRKQIIDTFTDEQWDSLSFVLSDHPKLAGFVK